VYDITRMHRVMSDRHVLVSDITLKWNLGLYNKYLKLHAITGQSINTLLQCLKITHQGKQGKNYIFCIGYYVFVYFVTTSKILRTWSVVLVVHIGNIIFWDYMVGKTCLAIIIMCLQCSDWPSSLMCWVNLLLSSTTCPGSAYFVIKTKFCCFNL
jgi:hypothetical protein